MIKTSDITFKDIKIEEATQKLREERDKILNEFAKAYLAGNEVNPSEIELVSQQKTENNVIETVYFFRKKTLEIK